MLEEEKEGIGITKISITSSEKHINEKIAHLTNKIDPSSMNLVHYQDFISELQEQFGIDNVECSIDSRKRHGRDLSLHPFSPPDIIVYPTDYSQIQWLVNKASQHDPPIPLISFGLGTSLQGQVLATKNGTITINMTKLSRMISIHPHDQDITVQAGMTRNRLEEITSQYGLFFPMDVDGVNVTIGGMIAMRSGGSSSLYYGSISDHILSIRYINNKGEIVKTGQRARRSQCGYNLTLLMAGSEGTLGIIIEATLRLLPISPSIMCALATFDDLESACNASCQIIQSPLPVVKCELVNEDSIRAMNADMNTNFKIQPTIFMEFHGMSDDILMNYIYNFSNTCHNNNSTTFHFIKNREEIKFLKFTMSQAWYSIQKWIMNADPNQKGNQKQKEIGTGMMIEKEMTIIDVAVPLSRFSGFMKNMWAWEFNQQQSSFVPIIGRPEDGCLFIFLMVDPNNSHDLYKQKDFNRHVIDCAMAAEGTCSSTYGIGIGKMEHLKQEIGITGWNTMCKLKELFDPLNIFNPGKMVQKSENE